MSSLGERIKQVRKLRGITQQEFSERTTVTQSYVSRLESGKETPTDMLLKLISLEFNISLEWLSTGKGSAELTKEDHDYFERYGTNDLHLGVYKRLEELSKALEIYTNSFIDVNISALLGQLTDFLISDFTISHKSIIIETIVTTMLEIMNAIDYIFRDDRKSQCENLEVSKMAYINSNYRTLRQTANTVYDKLMCIGEMSEEMAKNE